MEFLDHFNIKEKIGRGAFGSVWTAEYIKTPEIEVAVKVIDRKYV
jgi:serine/threonine protein kinase